MSKNSVLSITNKESLVRILELQKYPLEANDELILIAQEFPQSGLFDVILKAFNLGVIFGKRLERCKKLNDK